VIYQISDKIESKKGLQKFWAVKWKFFPSKRSFENFRPPKVGAKFPPMVILIDSLRNLNGKKVSQTKQTSLKADLTC